MQIAVFLCFLYSSRVLRVYLRSGGKWQILESKKEKKCKTEVQMAEFGLKMKTEAV